MTRYQPVDKAIYKKGYIDGYNGLDADKTDHIDYNRGYADGKYESLYEEEISRNPESIDGISRIG